MSLFALPVQRDWEDIQTMEDFLVSAWPALVVELGTGTGAFSLYLAGYCAIHGMEFHTFDTGKAEHSHQAPNKGATEAISMLGGHIHVMDVFDEWTISFIDDLVKKNGVSFIYCDNGNKEREVEIYAPLLKKGDYLGVHDFGNEIRELPRDGFKEWHWELFEVTGSTNRIIRKL